MTNEHDVADEREEGPVCQAMTERDDGFGHVRTVRCCHDYGHEGEHSFDSVDSIWWEPNLTLGVPDDQRV